MKGDETLRVTALFLRRQENRTEISEILEISLSTVERDWRLVRSWRSADLGR